MNTRSFPRASVIGVLIVPVILLGGCSTLTVQTGGVGAGSVSSAPSGLVCGRAANNTSVNTVTTPLAPLRF
jgi:hypothetical protein